MHRIDKLHMELPFAGSRMLQGLLVQEGFKVGRRHVVTLMKRMGIMEMISAVCGRGRARAHDVSQWNGPACARDG